MAWRHFVAANKFYCWTFLLLCVIITLSPANAWSRIAVNPSANSAAAATAASLDSANWVPSGRRAVSIPKSATSGVARAQRQLNEVSPYIDLALCPIRAEPWHCARQQSARILDVWDGELYGQWQKLKVEADRQLNSTLERRGYSASEVPLKEKPSTLLKKIEIGTNYMKEYLAETMDGFLGREYEYLLQSKASENSDEDADADNDSDGDGEGDGDGDSAGNDVESTDDTVEEDTDKDDDAEEEDDAEENEDNEDDNDNEETDGDAADEEKDTTANSVAHTDVHATDDNASSAGVEFIEIDDDQTNQAAISGADEQLKKPGGGKRKKKKGSKNKRKKKKGDVSQPATLVVVQAAQDAHDHHDDHDDVHQTVVSSAGGHGKPGKQKIKRRRQKQKQKKRRKGQHGGQQEEQTIIVEHEPTHNLGVGLLEDLAEADIWPGDDDDGHGHGGKRKHKFPTKYGRSNGVTRGKKKKKKKALQKLILLGSFLKAKIELLLKILGAHLQIKFFAIALIGLLINIARFWIDVKRGGTPQKVVYVEHAHHQHHYEDHGEDWSEPGSYWKRSLHTDSTLEDNDSVTDSYQLRPQQQLQPQQQQHDAHYLAYRNQWH